MSLNTENERRSLIDLWAIDGGVDEAGRRTLLDLWIISEAIDVYSGTSAYSFDGTQGLSKEISASALSGDFTIMFGVYNLTLPAIVISVGDIDITVYTAGGTQYVRFDDGVTNLTQALAWDLSDYTLIEIARKDSDLLFRENGIDLSSQAVSSLASYGSTVNIMQNVEGYIFDVRLKNSLVNEASFEYYNDDITDNSGDNTLPEW